jgi:hypothetical protein
MSPVFGHEVVRVSLVGQAEKFHVGKIARQTGRHMRFASVEGGSCRQVHDELENLVIRPAVNFTDLGQEQNGEQLLEDRLGKDQLKLSIKISIHNAGRR